jgi:hypothetical protein
LTHRRASALAILLTVAAVSLPGDAAAQSFVPQPQVYLLTTDVADARALWVQPAGLGKSREASVSALLTGNRYAGGYGIGQYGVTLASGVLAFGWQHDQVASGAKTNAFTVGLSGGTPVASVGFDRRWYSGTGTKDGSWDVGGRYLASRRLELSLVWRDISSPVVLGDTIYSTLVPGAALQLLRGRVHAGADWEVVTKGWRTGAVRLGATAVLPASLSLSLRAELNGRLRGNGIALGLTWGGRGARAAAFHSSVRAPDVDRTGLWGAAISTPFQRRRLGG